MKKILLLLVFFIAANIYAQNLNDEINSLEKDFKSFEYKKVLQKGRFLLSDTYATHSDSLMIFQYMLSSAYALNDSVQAKNIIFDILKSQPDFALNPKNTSPKIVEFFNFIKNEQIEKPKQVIADSTILLDNKQVNPIPGGVLLSGVLFPGSAHIFQGYKKNGFIFSAVTGALLGSTIYYFFSTESNREKYMSAKGQDNYNKLYSNYNSSYKMRNLFSAAYGLWSLYCLYDLQTQNNIRPIFDTQRQSLSLQFQHQW